MSIYKQKFEPVSKEVAPFVPVSYNFIYQFPKKSGKKGKSFYGVTDETLQTESFFPYGHPKPISKIIDYDAFSSQQAKRKK